MKWRASTLLALSFVLTFASCANIGPPEPPSLELPKPPSDLRATRKGDRITLTWTPPSATTDRQVLRLIGATRICRGTQSRLAQCGSEVGEVPPRSVTKKSGEKKISDSYTDTLPATMESDDPASSATYAIEVLNAEKRGAGLSNQVRVPLIHTLPAPADFAAKVTSSGVVLNWTAQAPPAANSLRYVYRVYRRLEGNPESVLTGEVGGTEANCCSVADSNIEWEKTYEYRVQGVTIIEQANKPALEVAGDDSSDAKVFADDVFPPSVPSGLQAVFSGPGQQLFVDLIWAPDTDADLAGYNVYRHEEGSPPVKLNSTVLKTPAYRDSQVAAGKNYFYSVSAVDRRSNESARSEETNEAVPEK